MAYRSENVFVFPSTDRFIYPQGKLTSENNFINILNSLKDYDSYVLEYSNNTLKVVIHGYYFEINNLVLSSNLYLTILTEYEMYGKLVSWNQDTQLDASGDFTGIMSSNGGPTDMPTWAKNQSQKYHTYSLQVTDSTGTIINLRKIDSDSVMYKSERSGSDIRSLSKDLNARQYAITAGTGLQGTGENKELTNIYGSKNEISINDTEMIKLRGLLNKGTPQQFVYFNGDGVATPTTADVGDSSSTSTADVYMRDGIIVEGRRVYMSKDNPDSSVGKIGDIWLKYAD